MLRVTNISATFELGREFNLRQVADNSEDIIYNPKKFSGAKYRCLSPNYSALLFYNGKVTLTGASSDENVSRSANHFYDYLTSLGHDGMKLSNLHINQYVGCLDIGQRLSLTSFYEQHRNECTYEIELFPGLMFRSKTCKTTFIMFCTGKINITGSASMADLIKADSYIRQQVSLL